MNLARSRIMRVVVNQPNAHVTTFVLQPDVTGGNDNLLVDGAPNDQNGSLDLIQFGGSIISGTYRSLIKFDLSAIPSNAIVTHADIEFTMVLDGTARASQSGMLLPYPLLRNWTELGSTYNKYDASNNWQTPGAAGALDAEPLSVGMGDFFTTDLIGDKKTLVLTPLSVQRWISGTLTNYGFLLKTAIGANDAYRVASSDHAIEAYRPKITVKYTTSRASLLRQITFAGDSKSNENDAWPSLLLDALLTSSGNIWYENPIRLAVAGYNTQQLRAYVDANISTLAGNPEVVLLNIGANDLSGLTGESTYKTALSGIVDAYLTKFPATVVYIAYPWRVGYDAAALTMKGWIDDVIATYPNRVQAGHDENVWFKPNIATYSYDGGTHYNMAGSVVCKNQWMTVLGY